MTAFLVYWPRTTLTDLAAVWLNAPDRQAVTSAQATIDHLLAADPISLSQHLSEGLYKLHVPPLTVYHTVDPVARKVEVQTVVHD